MASGSVSLCSSPALAELLSDDTIRPRKRRDNALTGNKY